MRAGVECGQALWCRSSWRRDASCDNVLRFRRFPSGFAFGPIMVWWER